MFCICFIVIQNIQINNVLDKIMGNRKFTQSNSNPIVFLINHQPPTPTIQLLV